MCQKTQTFKRFFLVVNHPPPLQKPYVLGLIKRTPQTELLFEYGRNKTFLNRKEVERVGITSPIQTHAYLLPVEVPRDWFLH